MGKYKFKNVGLEEKEETGHQMKDWCRAVQGYVSLTCQKGCYSLLQHSRTGEHKKKRPDQGETQSTSLDFSLQLHPWKVIKLGITLAQ